MSERAKVLKSVLGFSLAATILAVAVPAAAAEFPDRPVTVIVPFTAGGPTDQNARVMTEYLSKVWKQPIVVENRPGGGTLVGLSAVARAPKNGYTLGVGTPSFVISAALRDKMPFDANKDIQGIGMITMTPFVMVAHPSTKITSVADLVKAAKAAGDKPLTYATAGIGSAGHMLGEQIQQAANIKLTHVGYNGSAEAMPDVLTGRVPLMLDGLNSVTPYIESGKVVLVAATTSERLKVHPNVATFAETFPGLEGTSWGSLVGPAGLPDNILKKISEDLNKVLNDKAYQDAQLARNTFPAKPSSPAEFNAYKADLIEKWRTVGKAAGIKVE